LAVQSNNESEVRNGKIVPDIVLISIIGKNLGAPIDLWLSHALKRDEPIRVCS